MNPSKDMRKKARSGSVVALLVFAAVALLIAGPTNAQPEGQESPIAWQGHGSEHIEGCETGFHWIFSPGGGVSDVMLHTEINGTNQTPIAMDQAGQSGDGAWHANTTLVDTQENETPFVTFNGTAHHSAALRISDCLDDDEVDEVDDRDDVTDGNETTGNETGGNETGGNETGGNETTDETADEEIECFGPEEIRAVTSGEDIHVSWDAFAGADGYNLYRQEADGDMMLHATTDANTTSFLDDDVEVGTTYTYEVTATVDRDETEACDQVTITAIPVFPGVIGAVLATALGIAAYGVSRRRG